MHFLNKTVLISIKISLKFIPKGPINNIPALVQIMAWRRPGDKPLSEPMVIISLTHIWVTRPQWVNTLSCRWPNKVVVFTQGQFWPSGTVVVCVCVWVSIRPSVCQPLACPRDNWWPLQTRITKFWGFGVGWPWPSRSNWAWNQSFHFLACPRDHSTPIEVRISKFAPKVHISTVKIPLNIGLHRIWSSIQFDLSTNKQQVTDIGLLKVPWALRLYPTIDDVLHREEP